jgi:hypothetical protein
LVKFETSKWPPFKFFKLKWCEHGKILNGRHFEISKFTKLIYFSRVGIFNLYLHTEFHKNRLKNVEDKNYFIKNSKWGISGKRSI